MSDALALATLIAAGGPLAPRRALLEAAGNARAALRDPSLWSASGVSGAQAAALRRPDATMLDAVSRWLAAPGHRLLAFNDPDYPPALRHAASPPLALCVAGDPALLWRPAIAVVGSRGPTPAGREHAAEFARAFARAGFVVGSGLAAGIDAAAHAATLAVDGGTVAVLGTGPDVVYPRSNTELHRRIAEAGALVTEHLPGTGPRREHFPSRNRLLAALCLGTVVVEAAERSGAMITARLAADAGREVFALPGSIRNPLARGCHRLIRDGATLVQSPEDVIEQLGAAAAEEAAAHRRELDRPAPAADEWTASNDAAMPGSDHEVLWKVLGFDPTDMDQLIERTGLTPSRLSSMLLVMELEGRVAQQHGRFFRVA
ncbi:DNA processing protein DprA [Lysobacter xinjiangensis]|uniref:DNA processing protein DprA n=1 Tax=Cognatilysobacter xinjiangensis TaxID=546892 RepID=A0ABQ3C5Y6_9GAMM|nr:DNA-processing protein DprA [Lysobacter xinjiangensis]GGZ69946.1 DNA processing protein DprA [Lysobacter xinjiangensis]